MKLFLHLKQCVNIILVIGLLLLPLALHAEEAASCGSRNLIALTPPVVGYSTVEGTIYNFLPFSFERAVNERVGVRADSSLLYYNSAYQAYSIKLSVPIYQKTCSPDRNYYGFYAAPLVAAMVHRQPNTTRAIRGGFEAGYAWPVGTGMQFDLGYWHVFDALSYRRAGSGLIIALGFWF